MEQNAELAQDIELTPENWLKLFGEDGKVKTPIGEVKMGENQFIKLYSRNRAAYLGMIKPTLTSPDIVLEESEPREGVERESKYLFIKTFKKSDGSRIVNFESVTIQRDGMEVSISSHEIENDALKKKMQNDKILHLLNDLSINSEWRLIDTPIETERPDLVPTSDNNPSDSKITNSSEEKQEITEKSAENSAETETTAELDAYGFPVGATPAEIHSLLIEDGADANEIAEYADSHIKRIQKDRKAVENKKHKNTLDRRELKAAREERNALLEAADAELSKWNEVKNLSEQKAKESIEEKLNAQQEERNALAEQKRQQADEQSNTEADSEADTTADKNESPISSVAQNQAEVEAEEADTEVEATAEETETAETDKKTRKSTKKFDRTIPPTIEAQRKAIRSIIEFAKSVKNRVQRAVIGGITIRQINDLKKEGIDIDSSWVHSFESSAVRHNQNQHGNQKIEDERGQIAITEDDYTKIPEILNSYDKVTKSANLSRSTGNEVIIYEKEFEDGYVYYLEEKRDNRESLSFHTMYNIKRKKELIVPTG